MQSKKNEIFNIQVLRAVAALLVVLLHSMNVSTDYGFDKGLILKLKGWGYGGVDLFFVISGFIMTHIQSLRKYSATTFFIKRLIRIVPLYWILTILMLVAYILFPAYFNTVKISPEWALASLLFLSQESVNRFPLLYDGWTLEVEMMFYIVLSFLLIFKRDIIHTVLYTIFILICITLISKNFLLLEFAAGMLLGLIYQQHRLRSPYALLLLGVILFLLTIFIAPSNDLSFRRFIILGIPSLLIVYGALGVPQMKNPLAILIGDASYSIYLVQVFTLPVSYKILRLVGADVDLSDLYILTSIIITIISGCILHLLVEKKVSLLFTRFGP